MTKIHFFVCNVYIIKTELCPSHAEGAFELLKTAVPLSNSYFLAVLRSKIAVLPYFRLLSPEQCVQSILDIL